MPEISVIIPVYNVEKHLNHCIDSVLAQTFKNFECVLINDGSPDNSGKICDEYAGKDSRIIVIHQENKGVSAARNAGLDKAQGEWLTFIDSDDWVEPKYLEVMYNNAIKYNCNLSICGMQSVDENNKSLYKSEQFPITFFDKTAAKKAIFCFKYFTTSTVCKLVKLKYVRENNIYFDTNIKVCEDGLFWFELIDKINKVTYDSTPYYNYLKCSDSITNYKNENFYLNYMTVFVATKKMLLLETNETVKRKIKSYNVLVANYIYNNIIKNYPVDRKNYLYYRNIISENLLFYLSDSNISIRDKIKVFFVFCPNLYKKILHIIKIQRNKQ